MKNVAPLPAATTRWARSRTGTSGFSARVLLDNEGDDEYDAHPKEDEHAGVGPRPPRAGDLIEREHEGRDPPRQERRADEVEAAHALRNERSQGRGDEHEPEETDGDVDVEDPAPGREAQDGAPQKGSGHDRDAENSGEQSDDPSPGLGRKGDRDDGDPNREEASAPEPLDRAKHNEFRKVLAEAGEDRTDDEDEEPAQEHVPATAKIGELRKDRNGDGGRDDVGADDERSAVRLPKISEDRGERREDDEVIERTHQEREENPHDHEDLESAAGPDRGFGDLDLRVRIGRSVRHALLPGGDRTGTGVR